MKISATYTFKQVVGTSTLWFYKIQKRAGDYTLIDEMLAINHRFGLQKMGQKKKRNECTYSLWVNKLAPVQQVDVKLRWFQRQAIGICEFRKRNECLIVLFDDDELQILICDIENRFCLHNYFGVGLFRVGKDEKVEAELKRLKSFETDVSDIYKREKVVKTVTKQ